MRESINLETSEGIEMEKQITVLAATSQKDLENNGADMEDTQCLTILDAKRRARYFLTDEFMNRSESTVQLHYAQVLVDGQVRHDFYAD